jgi:hypothetical protein
VVDLEDLEIVSRLVDDVNAAIHHRRKRVKIVVGLAVFSIGALPLLTESIAGIWKILALVVTGAIGSILAFFQLLDRPTGLNAQVESFGRRKLTELATNRGLNPKLAKFRLADRDDEFKFISSAEGDVISSAEGDVSPQDGLSALRNPSLCGAAA